MCARRFGTRDGGFGKEVMAVCSYGPMYSWPYIVMALYSCGRRLWQRSSASRIKMTRTTSRLRSAAIRILATQPRVGTHRVGTQLNPAHPHECTDTRAHAHARAHRRMHARTLGCTHLRTHPSRRRRARGTCPRVCAHGHTQGLCSEGRGRGSAETY